METLSQEMMLLTLFGTQYKCAEWNFLISSLYKNFHLGLLFFLNKHHQQKYNKSSYPCLLLLSQILTNQNMQMKDIDNSEKKKNHFTWENTLLKFSYYFINIKCEVYLLLLKIYMSLFPDNYYHYYYYY